MANKSTCPCSAPQPLVDGVFDLIVRMIVRLDPAWHYRMVQQARHLPKE